MVGRCAVAAAFCLMASVPAANGRMLGQRLRIRQRQRSQADIVARLSAPVPPPAPDVQSFLPQTTAIPSTTIFSPAARIGAEAWDSYQNEMNFGRPEINATAAATIVVPTGPPDMQSDANADASFGFAPPPAEVPSTTIMVQPAQAPSQTDGLFRNESALDCQVGEWTEWADCSADGGGDGLRGWHEVRYRPIITPHQLGGLICLPHVMRRPCPRGGWSSDQAYWQYTYGPGGTSSGLPGGAISPWDVPSFGGGGGGGWGPGGGGGGWGPGNWGPGNWGPGGWGGGSGHCDCSSGNSTKTALLEIHTAEHTDEHQGASRHLVGLTVTVRGKRACLCDEEPRVVNADPDE